MPSMTCLHQLIAWHKLIVLVTWFKFYFPLFWDMVTHDDEFKTKGNKIPTKDKIEPQHIREGPEYFSMTYVEQPEVLTT